MNKIERLLSWFLCKVGDHDWTTSANEGKKPTTQQAQGGILGFWDYAKMYCKKCGKISDLNR